MKSITGSLRAYARHRETLGLDGATLAAVQKALLQGRIKAKADRSIDFAKADEAWRRNTKPRTSVQSASRGSEKKSRRKTSRSDVEVAAEAKRKTTGEESNKGPDAYLDARTRTEVARAKELELKVAALEKRLLPAAEVEETWSAAISATRNRLLLIPSKLAPKLLEKQDVREVQVLIEKAIKEALTALASDEHEPDPATGPKGS